MEMKFQGWSFAKVKEKAIQIYQNNSDILDFTISHKRDTDIWIVKFRRPNPTFQKIMLDN
jgi:hypothetical protein